MAKPPAVCPHASKFYPPPCPSSSSNDDVALPPSHGKQDLAVKPARKAWAKDLWRPFACMVSGMLMFLSCATFDLWPLAWFALVPALFAIRDLSPLRAAWLGWLVGLVANAGGFYWLCGLLERFGHMPKVGAVP